MEVCLFSCVLIRLLIWVPFTQIAAAFWSVTLAPYYPIMTEIIEFINVSVAYFGVISIRPDGSS